MNNTFDVVIVGAGPGGSATAYFLARRGLDVLLVDKYHFPRDKTCGDGLSPRAVGVLAEMGVLEELLPRGFAIEAIEIVAPGGRSTAAPVPRQKGLPDYALVVPRLTLDDALRRRAVAAGARFMGGVHATDVRRAGERVEIAAAQAGTQRTLRGRVAVLAVGASVRLLLRIGLLSSTPPMMLAARAYFDDLQALADRARFHFDGVPLPGYGWVFPLSETSANLGAGYFQAGFSGRGAPANAAQALTAFTRHPPLRNLLRQGRRMGPVKGYPLRVDFASAPTYGEGVLLVGEAAGLVNPLTGEGIDYALESGKMAAEHLAAMLANDRPSRGYLAAYDLSLRQRFQRQFVFCNRVRDLFMGRLRMDGLIWLADRRPDLKMALIRIALGYQETVADLSLRNFWRALLR